MPEIETPPTPPAVPVAPAAPPTDWRAGLHEDLRAEKSLESFKGADWAEVGPVLAKSFVETKRLVGSAVKVPAADAAPEEWAAFYTAAGRPESPDKYGVADPVFPPKLKIRVDSEARKEFLGIAHGAGFTTAQVQKALGWYDEYTLKQVDAQIRETAEARKTAEAALKQEWGSAFQRNTGLARATVNTLFGNDPEIAAAVEDMGNNVALVKGFVRIGEILHERGEIRGDEVSTGRTVSEIEAEIERIKTAPNAENDKTAADRILNLTRELLSVRDRK